MNWKKHTTNILAATFLLAVPLWIFLILPNFFVISSDFTQSTQVDSFDNFYDQKTGTYPGDQQSATTFSYKATKTEGSTVVIRNLFDVRTLTGEKIFSVSRMYGINMHTGVHVFGQGDHDRMGYLFAPRMKGIISQAADKSSFDYWHVNYDVPAHMEYRSTESFYGLNLYYYEANFKADQTKDLSGVLPGVGVDKGVTLDVQLGLWVEPYTGRIIQYKDKTEAFYYDLASGKRLYPWNKFHNNTSSFSAAEQAKIAGWLKMEIILREFGVPLIFVLISLFFFLYPFIKRRLDKKTLDLPKTKNKFAAPVLVGLLLMIATVGLVFVFYNLSRQQSEADFGVETERINVAIDRGLKVNADLLRGAQGLFNASKSVTRDEWSAYTNSLNMPSNYPAILGLAFGKVVNGQDKNKFIDSIHKEGFLNFSINPSGERSSYVPVQYIEPFNEVNKNAFGFDMESEPVRQSAMHLARDSGDIVLSGKIILAQDSSTSPQPAFIIYAPTYKHGVLPDTIKKRQNSIDGYVYAALRMKNLMLAILTLNPTNLGIEIYDGGQTDNLTPDRLMYRNDLAAPSAPFSKISTINFYGHQWTIRYTAPNSFAESIVRRSLPIAVFFLGLMLSFLVSFVLYVINTRREQAELIAREMSIDLITKNKNIEEAKAKDEAILAGIGDGIAVADENGELIFLNKVAEDILGDGAENNLSDTWQEKYGIFDAKTLQPLSAEQMPLFRAVKGEVVTKLSLLIRNAKTPKGRTISVTATPISLNGKNIGGVGIFRDITKENDIDKAKSEFVSLASHQLRTPLSAINWYTEMLLAGDAGQINLQQKKYLNEIYTGSQRMVELVNALLDVSYLELGMLSGEPKPTDMLELLQSIVNEQKLAINKKKLQLKQNLPTELPTLETDPKLMRMVFQNLLSNSVKYTPSGGTIEISMSLVNRGDRVDSQKVTEPSILIKIKDTGYGIPKEQQDMIFTKLFRADNVREQDAEGTGLGLYIAKSVIEYSKGKIWFKSEKDRGAVFFVILPLGEVKKKRGSKPPL